MATQSRIAYPVPIIAGSLLLIGCAQGTLGVSPSTVLSTIILGSGGATTTRSGNTTTTTTRTTSTRTIPSHAPMPKSPAPTAAASRVLETADQYVGVRYTWGGNTVNGGFDCSGFTKFVFAKQGIELPRTSREQVRAGRAVPADFASLRPGDIMFFADPGEAISHVAIYVGNGEIIHSSSSVGGVGYTDLNTGGDWFVQNFVAARRVM